MLINRKQPIRGLWERNGTFSIRLAVEDDATSEINRRVSLPLSKKEFLKDIKEKQIQIEPARRKNMLNHFRAMEELLPFIGAIPKKP